MVEFNGGTGTPCPPPRTAPDYRQYDQRCRVFAVKTTRTEVWVEVLSEGAASEGVDQSWSIYVIKRDQTLLIIHKHPHLLRLRQRRRKQQVATERAGMAKLPDLKDAEAVQKFFLEEIQLGEELLAQGDYEKGVDHLTNAIAVCGQPQQLLQVLQQTLPPPVFQMLLTKLPSISQRIVSAQSLSEDDIE
ncbi:mitochondrial import receptor subunit TOM20 homolog [Gymnodraco acuticeps]|uniref:Mitochondrial import receptor subunit TOM20 homolog n=1 Tax=Gymnodraco acuticeps TaxID=8218 RepID=A0A6P8TDD4_GYMAC|nr:mitochondrial import receptor subunit TOM20 homolog [Gymnodraco acuticeps]